MSQITTQTQNITKTTAPNSTPPPPSDQEIKHESSKAAQQSLALQRKAHNLKQAAAGARDADHRQQLLEQALDAEIAAESFGKTAKYLRSGTFQGMCAGGGMGVMPGMTLGALTGTLVGGVVGTVTGGLGAGIGALVGAVHGPFWNMGEVVGRGIRSVTGDLPWSAEASEEEKRRLEEMIGQCGEEEMPGREELMGFVRDAGGAAWGKGSDYVKGWGDYVWSWVPGFGDWGKSGGGGKSKETKEGKAKRQNIERYHEGRVDQRSVDALAARDEEQARAQNVADQQHTRSTPGEKRKPRKLEQRSTGQTSQQTQKTTPQTRRPPKKLEVRSQAG